MNIEQQKKISTIVIGAFLLFLVFYAGIHYGQRNIRNTINVQDPQVTEEQMEPFWKAWNVISEKFVTASSTDTEQRIWGAIQGLANSQNDPYTVFFPPEQDKTFKGDISGNFEGVGMEIGIKDGVLIVVSPLKDSPAARAGVMTGDKILKIDDTLASDMAVDQAVKLIRGVKGTTVKILFSRDGVAEPIEKSIVRDIINIPTLDTDIKDNVFIIRLYSYSEKSPELFRAAMRKFIESGHNKLLIDLRGNPGGYLNAAWDMASWFLPVGKVIVTEDFGGKGENIVYRSKGYDVMNKYFGTGNYKVAILVNNGSASAAEIMAGALQEHGIAKLVGIKTFGKGSVQELVSITNDTSLKVTIARWLTPNGHNLSHDGLLPDYEVKMTQKDMENKKDPQQDKAIEILQK